METPGRKSVGEVEDLPTYERKPVTAISGPWHPRHPATDRAQNVPDGGKSQKGVSESERPPAAHEKSPPQGGKRGARGAETQYTGGPQHQADRPPRPH
eukprot:2990025-Alexandrium_andersonii.AAC.1